MEEYDQEDWRFHAIKVPIKMGKSTKHWGIIPSVGGFQENFKYLQIQNSIVIYFSLICDSAVLACFFECDNSWVVTRAVGHV